MGRRGGQRGGGGGRSSALHREALAQFDASLRETRQALEHVVPGSAEAKRLLERINDLSYQRAKYEAANITPAPSGFVSAVPVIRVGDWQGAKGQSHPETPTFYKGSELLGYLEGRPGVVGIIAVQPNGLPPLGERASIDPGVRDRIENLSLVQARQGRERQRMINILLDLYDYIDYKGGTVEFEIEYESAPPR